MSNWPLGIVSGANFSSVTQGEIWVWGNNTEYGQNGMGNKTHTAVPTQPSVSPGTAVNWTNGAGVVTSRYFINADGKLYSAGRNHHGQLGNGTVVNQSVLLQVGSDTDWLDAVCLNSDNTTGFVVFVKSDNTWWQWGSNYRGIAGDGTEENHSTPTQLGSDTHWKTGAVGVRHVIAIKTDGTMWSWGDHQNGKLGHPSDVSARRSSPVQIGSDSNWADVCAGSNFSCAVKTNGTLWHWGVGASGVSGTGDSNNNLVPTQIGSATNWVQMDGIAAGQTHMAALNTDGKLYAWGNNAYDQLGNNDRGNNQNTPQQIGSDTDWYAGDSTAAGQGPLTGGLRTGKITAGGDFCVALKPNGSLWFWGKLSMQGGNAPFNTSGYKVVPTQIGSDTTWFNCGCNATSGGWAMKVPD